MFNVFKSKRNMANPWFFAGKTMPPSFHVHNSKCDNPTLAQNGRGELQGSQPQPSLWGKSDGMTQLSTIPNKLNKNSLNPKINPKTKHQNPNHPTIPMPTPSLSVSMLPVAKPVQGADMISIETSCCPCGCEEKRTKKETLKQSGFLWCTSAIQKNKRSVKPPPAPPWWLVAKDPLLPPETSRNHWNRGLHGGKSWNHLVTRVAWLVGWRKTYPNFCHPDIETNNCKGFDLEII